MSGLPGSGPAGVRQVRSFQELAATPFADGVNAICWERSLPGDFGEIVRLLGPGDGVVALDEDRLLSLPASPAGRVAIDAMVADLRRLRDRELDPVLNCIHAYPRDDDGPVPTDVISFHADSAPVPAETWLCTYHGAPSEGLPDEDAVRHINVPAIRAELLRRFGGADDAAFREHLAENCYDLHYLPRPGARPFSFGVGHLWRIAIEHPGCPVPPCIHRAPDTVPGEPRLLLIS